MRCALVLFLCHLLGCASLQSPLLDPLSVAYTIEGERFAASGRTGAARHAYEAALAADSRNVRAGEQLQDLLVRRDGPARHRRLWRPRADRPDATGPTLYLAARIESLPGSEGPNPGLRSRLRRSIDRAPWLVGARLLLARSLAREEQFEEAADLLHGARGLAPLDPDAWELSGQVAFRLYAWKEAIRFFQRASRLDPRRVRPHIFLAIDALAERRYLDAVDRFERINRWSPEHEWTGEERFAHRLALDRSLKKLRSTGRPGEARSLARHATERLDHPDLWAHRGDISFELGDTEESERAFRKALELDPYHLVAARGLRRILFARGRLGEGMAIWERTVPIEQVLHAQNRVGDRYARVYELLAQLETTGRTPENRLEWARALARVGWIEEAADAYQALSPTARSSHRVEIEDLLAFRGFLVELRRLFDRLYRKRAAGKSLPSFRTIRQQMQNLGSDRLRFDPEADLQHYYLVFSEVDPFRAGTDGLTALLGRYNHVADLSNGTGEVELRLMHILTRRRVMREVFTGRRHSYEILLTDRTRILNYPETLWGNLRLSGRAFLSRSGTYLCLDTLQRGKPSLQWMIKRARRPLPPPSDIEGIDWDPRAALRLEQRHLEEELQIDLTPGTQIDWDRLQAAHTNALLSNVGVHERGHVADFHHYVPISRHLLRNLGMAIGQGFSPSRIHTRFEETAEMYAISRSQYPLLSLLDNLRRLDFDPDNLIDRIRIAWEETSPTDSPYTRGARHIFERIARFLPRQGVHHSIPERISLLPGERIRKMARQCLRPDGLD